MKIPASPAPVKLTRDHPAWPEFERRLREALAGDRCTHRTTNRAIAILRQMGLPADVAGVMPSTRTASPFSGYAECDCRILEGSSPPPAPAA